MSNLDRVFLVLQLPRGRGRSILKNPVGATYNKHQIFSFMHVNAVLEISVEGLTLYSFYLLDL